MLCVPLANQTGEVMGVLQAVGEGERHLTASHLSLVAGLAHQLAVYAIIINAQASRELRRLLPLV